VRILETCTILAEKEYSKLEDQADFNKRVDPLKYVSKLVTSVLTLFLGLSVIAINVLKFLQIFGPGDD